MKPWQAMAWFAVLWWLAGDLGTILAWALVGGWAMIWLAILASLALAAIYQLWLTMARRRLIRRRLGL